VRDTDAGAGFIRGGLGFNIRIVVDLPNGPDNEWFESNFSFFSTLNEENALFLLRRLGAKFFEWHLKNQEAVELLADEAEVTFGGEGEVRYNGEMEFGGEGEDRYRGRHNG
jgi:hypothetical protein